mgnify:FL=1|jgi:hypothetical protein|nr:MAG TPA: hypothetical protein [Caudoviricetes sp.]DAU27583.1 MAG TPA: hypothetical protein [Caudoviricetes sp.]
MTIDEIKEIAKKQFSYDIAAILEDKDFYYVHYTEKDAAFEPPQMPTITIHKITKKIGWLVLPEDLPILQQAKRIA